MKKLMKKVMNLKVKKIWLLPTEAVLLLLAFLVGYIYYAP